MRCSALVAAMSACLLLAVSSQFAQDAPPAAGRTASGLATSTSHAADWPQWRGPDRTGIARQSPALLDEFPKDGPKKVWESEDAILCGDSAGGNGSIAVSGGKAYVKEHTETPAAWRMITKDTLARLGYCPGMPPELAKKLEDARVCEALKRQRGSLWTELQWIDQWVKTNTTPEESEYEAAIRYRLTLGRQAVPLDLLDKLVPIVDKKFENQADWVKWLEGSGLDADAQASLRALPVQEETRESLYCLNAASGKTLWKSSMSAGHSKPYYSSGTPTVSEGKVFISSVANTIYCFDADTGKKLWESAAFGKAAWKHGHDSSVLLHEGAAVFVTARGVTAVSAADGKTLWSVPGTSYNAAGSAVVWSGGGKSYVLAEFERHLKMLDPKTGEEVAAAEGGGDCTPNISGDFAVTSNEGGTHAYKLSPTSIQSLWTAPFKDNFASPLIDGKYVYVLGGSDYYGKETRPGKAVCLELETGKVMWQETMSLANYGSLALADGKLIAVVGKELVVFKASPEKFQLVGRANLGLVRWVSPAIVDGKVFLRTSTKVVCYDLAKQRTDAGE